MNATDITDLSDDALDVFLSVRCGEDVDVGHLSIADRFAVAKALGFDSARTVAWAGSLEPVRTASPRRCYERAILDRQDAETE